MDVVRNFLARYEQTREEEMSLEEYLELCKRDPLRTPPPPSACWPRSASPRWSTPGTTRACRASSATR